MYISGVEAATVNLLIHLCSNVFLFYPLIKRVNQIFSQVGYILKCLKTTTTKIINHRVIILHQMLLMVKIVSLNGVYH